MGFLNCLRYGNFFKVMGFIGATVHHCWQVFVIECIRNTRRVCQIFSKNIWTRVHLVDPCRMMHWPCKSLKLSFLKWFWRCLENNEKTVGIYRKVVWEPFKKYINSKLPIFHKLLSLPKAYPDHFPNWYTSLGAKTRTQNSSRIIFFIFFTRYLYLSIFLYVYSVYKA